MSFFLMTLSQGAASSDNTFTVTPTDGQYVYVKITKNGCEVQSSSVTITVNNLPDPSLITPGFAGTIICETPPTVKLFQLQVLLIHFILMMYLAVDGSVTSNTLDLSKVDLSGSTTVTIDVVVTNLTTGCSKRTSVNDGNSLVFLQSIDLKGLTILLLIKLVTVQEKIQKLFLEMQTQPQVKEH